MATVAPLAAPTIAAAQSIQHLLAEKGSNLSSLPSQYASRNPGNDENIVEGDIPVVDFALLTSTNPEERKRGVEELASACREWGFFMLINHGVPESLRQGMMECLMRFFSMTEDEKRESAGEHISSPIRYGTSFNTSAEDYRYWRDYLKMFVHPVFNCPTKPEGLSETVKAYTDSIRSKGKELIKAMLESLGVGEEYMETGLNFSKCLQNVVCNFYPPCPQPELTLGMPPHSDYGLFTFLLTNGVPGLQVKHGDKWVRVKPLPEAFLVNCGDHTEIVSNGRYESILHRAEVNNKTIRISIATVIGTSSDTVVAPAAPLLEREPAKFRGVGYKEYFELQQGNKLNGKTTLDPLKLY